MTGQSSSYKNSYKFSVAPMLDCTDRHFRVLMRQVSRKALLYTEMIVAQALHHSKNRKKLLDFDEIEHPIAIQIGGDDPILLAEATKLAETWGYDEINLNIGCPSSKVQSGNFGACLMANPSLVAKCVEAMVNASNLPVTVKHRIGIDNLDSDAFLKEFVDHVAAAGAKRFSIHARKALLKGLNPKQNRNIPPLLYEKVINLKKCRPSLIIELNGGLNTPNDCRKILEQVDGAMVGRAAYKDPLLWQTVDEIIYGEKAQNLNASKVLKGLIPYTEKHLRKGGRFWDIAKHCLQLVKNVPGAKQWRNEISIQGIRPEANLSVLEECIEKLEDAGL